jgi:hypothetical protein
MLALLGSAIVIVGTFLPWGGLDSSIASDLGLDETASGWSTLDGETGDGPLFLVLGLAIGVFGLLALRGTVNLGTKIAAIITGAVTVFFVLAEFGSIASDNDDLNVLGFDDPLSYEFGLFVLALGAVVGLVGSCLYRRRA